ncbi:TPA: hypothetical protein ACJI8J_004579 [Kluyvera georgiana]
MGITDLIRHLNFNDLKPDKGHLSPTASKYQTVLFDQRNNLRMIIEAQDDELYWVVIPTNEEATKFLEKNSSGNLITDVEESINTITTVEYQKELIKIAVELSKSGRGKAIVVK